MTIQIQRTTDKSERRIGGDHPIAPRIHNRRVIGKRQVGAAGGQRGHQSPHLLDRLAVKERCAVNLQILLTTDPGISHDGRATARFPS